MKPVDLLLLKEFLDEKHLLYNNKKFIESDPISVPHLFTKKQDIEIAAFFAAPLPGAIGKALLRMLINLCD